MSEEATYSSAETTAVQRQPVWGRVLLVGVSVGALQVAVNQGDYWLRGAVDATVVIKTVLSPLITLTVAVLSAVCAWRQ